MESQIMIDRAKYPKAATLQNQREQAFQIEQDRQKIARKVEAAKRKTDEETETPAERIDT